MLSISHLRSICLKLLLGGLFCSISFGASTGEFTVKDLQELCAVPSSDELGKAACSFFIFGAFQGLDIGSAQKEPGSNKLQESKSKTFCVPDGLPKDTMVSHVMKMMKWDLANYPEDRNMPAISFIAAVIVKDFPCKRTQ